MGPLARLGMLLMRLTTWIDVARKLRTVFAPRAGGARAPSPSPSPSPSTRRRGQSNRGLRPPTLMLDLLLGTLMLFAFQLGPGGKAVDQQPMRATGQAQKDKPTRPLVLTPVRTDGGWTYHEVQSERTLSAPEVAARVQSSDRRVVLQTGTSMPVGTYLEAQRPLRSRSLRVGVTVKGGGRNESSQ